VVPEKGLAAKGLATAVTVCGVRCFTVCFRLHAFMTMF
jgi:hypothetical protein